MGEHMRAKRPSDASGTAEVPSALPKSRLVGYRAAVGDLVSETSRHPRTSDLLAAEELIAKRLGEPEFADVLSHFDGSMDAVAARLTHEIRNYQPSVRSSASGLPTFIRIFLLSQIDSVWWARGGSFRLRRRCAVRH